MRSTTVLFQHLLDVCSDDKLIACKDIFDSEGQLICARETPLKEKHCRSFIHNGRLEEIETQFYLRDGLTAKRLYMTINGFLESDSSFQVYAALQNHTKMMKELCEVACQNAKLRLRLSLLWRVYPKVFDRSLFCGAFGAMMYFANGKEKKDIENIFIAGVYQDIGVLELAVSLVSEDALDPKDYHAFYEHAMFGAGFLAKTNCFAESVISAITEHHEHIDGTGFPKGRQGLTLSELGQTVHILGNLYAVYQDHFKPRNRKLCDTVPIIEMNSVSRFGAIAKTLIGFLNKVDRSNSDISEEALKPIFNAVRERHFYIKESIKVIEEFTRSVGFRHDNKALFTLQNAFIHIAVILIKSRTFNDGYLRWLDQVEEYKLQHAYQEVEDVFLMTNEVIYHIQKFKKNLRYYVEDCSIDRVRLAVNETLEKLENISKRSLNGKPGSMGLIEF